MKYHAEGTRRFVVRATHVKSLSPDYEKRRTLRNTVSHTITSAVTEKPFQGAMTRTTRDQANV